MKHITFSRAELLALVWAKPVAPNGRPSGLRTSPRLIRVPKEFGCLPRPSFLLSDITHLIRLFFNLAKWLTCHTMDGRLAGGLLPARDERIHVLRLKLIHAAASAGTRCGKQRGAAAAKRVKHDPLPV